MLPLLQPLRLGYTVVAGSARRNPPAQGAEGRRAHVMPTGDAFARVGLYLNELLLRLLARDDPHAELFDLYAGVVRVLAGRMVRRWSPCCAPLSCCCCARWALLPALDADSTTLAALRSAGALRAGGPKAAASGVGWRLRHARGRCGQKAAAGAGGARGLSCGCCALVLAWRRS